ncbi:MAG: hypothetical protein NTV86_06180 [Planctomycetota bacterium]|nr:hypothetical protein [Planctomycetota bacterium]
MNRESEDRTSPVGRSPVTGVMPWLGVLALLTAGGFMVSRALANARAGCGQIAYDIRQVYLPCGLACLWGILGLTRPGGRRGVALVLIAVSVLLAVLVLVLDQFNLLVEYGRWLSRGMPAPWQWGAAVP